MRSKLLLSFFVAALCLALTLTNNEPTTTEALNAAANKTAASRFLNGSWNLMGQVLAIVLDYSTKFYTTLISYGSSIYSDKVSAYLNSASGQVHAQTRTIRNNFNQVVSKMEVSIQSSSAAIMEQFQQLVSVYGEVDDSTRELLSPYMTELAALISRMKNPDTYELCDYSKAAVLIRSMTAIFDKSLYAGLIPADNLSTYEWIELTLVSFISFFVYYIVLLQQLVVQHVDLLSVVAGVVIVAAVYLSFKLSLFVGRTIVWLIKIPFRIILAIYRYIFGYSQEMDFDVDQEALIEECYKAPEAPQRDSRSPTKSEPISHHLDGSEGTDTTNVLGAKLHSRQLVDEDLSFESADEDFAGFAKGAEESSKKDSVPTSSAAVASTLVAAVASVALFLL